MDQSNATLATSGNISSHISPTNITTANDNDHPDHSNAGGIDTVNVVIPLIIIGLLVTVAIGILFFVRRKSQRKQRQQFAPHYFSVGHEESGNEWESRLMDDELSRHVSIVKPNKGNQARLMLEKVGPTSS